MDIVTRPSPFEFLCAPHGVRGSSIRPRVKNRMSTNPLSQLEFTRRTAKRAQYEAFEYSLTSQGVLVRNASHENPAEHEYTVTVENGVPTACDCPADKYYEGACKHRVSVAIRKPVIEAASQRQLIADGGEIQTQRTEESVREGTGQDQPSTQQADEDCTCPGDDDSFPCWECVRTDRRSLEGF